MQLIKPEEITETQKKVAKFTSYTDEEVAIIQKQVFKDSKASELGYFLKLSQSLGLNPFNKEIWAYKDAQSNVVIFAGRDGLLRKAQESPLFCGMSSSDVCENDKIEIDIPNGIVEHKINPIQPRGKIVGAYAIVRRANETPVVVYRSIDEYDRNNNIWNKYKPDMITKVVEGKALKKAFGFSGVAVEGDMESTKEGIIDVEHEDISNDFKE